MSGVHKIFQVDIGREQTGTKEFRYHAHFISVLDRKIGVKKEATLHGLMQSVSRIIRKKEKENLLFPVKEVPEPSNLVIVPNGASQIHS